MSEAPPTSELPSPKRSRFRKLRIAVSVFFGVLTLLLVVMWGRSHSWMELATYNGERLISFGYNSGYAYFVRQNISPDYASRTKHGWYTYSSAATKKLPKFEWSRTPPQTKITVPFWFLTVAASSLACLPWVAYYFSLRTLLIATTLVAVVLGLAVWAGS